MRTLVLSVLSALCVLSCSATVSIDFLDLEVSRAQWLTGPQSNTLATALQPADLAGWEHGPHLDWLLSVPPLPYTQITNAPWLTAAALPSGIVTNCAAPTFSGLSLIRYTNAVSATTFLIDNGEDAPASVYGLYFYKDANHSTNAAGWSLYYEGVGTRYLSYGAEGVYTFMGGSLPKFNSSGTGIATGSIRLSQASLPVGYATDVITTNGVEGSVLRAGSVGLSALAAEAIGISAYNVSNIVSGMTTGMVTNNQSSVVIGAMSVTSNSASVSGTLSASTLSGVYIAASSNGSLGAPAIGRSASVAGLYFPDNYSMGLTARGVEILRLTTNNLTVFSNMLVSNGTIRAEQDSGTSVFDIYRSGVKYGQIVPGASGPILSPTSGKDLFLYNAQSKGVTVKNTSGEVQVYSNLVAGGRIDAKEVYANNLPLTPSWMTPLVNVATGATTTVAWSYEPQIAYIDLYTPTVITNTFPALNCITNLVKETWINAASTNALTITWDPRIEWQDGITPEMTCTGLYKFAFSTACGNKIQGRQTWPSTVRWQSCLIAAGSYGTTTVASRGFSAAGTKTNDFAIITPPALNHGPVLLKMTAQFYNETSTGSVQRCDGVTLAASGAESNQKYWNGRVTLTLPAGTDTGFARLRIVSTTALSGNSYTSWLVARPANENESAYIGAGGVLP